MPRPPVLPALVAAGLTLCLAATAVPAASYADEPGTRSGTTSAAAASDDATVTVTGLQTNARVDPLGIPGEAPSLSWRATSAARGVMQTAYQVRVAASEAQLASTTLWDTAKVVSDEQTDVVYGGPALTSGTRYVWQVRTWDGTDTASAWSEPASFETGLFAPSDWNGASWIGQSTSGEVDTWTDYTADIDFDIDALAIGVFVRAATARDAYMWQISTADGTGVPKFRPHKRVNNGYALLGNIPITSISSAALLSGTHRLSITVDGAQLTTRLDGVQIDQRSDSSFTKGFVGFRQDFADGQGDESVDIKAVKVTAEDGDVLLDTDFSAGNPFDGGRLTADGLRVAERKDVLYRSQDANKPLLRTGFTVPSGKTVASARVYASAQGVYELQLNGEKVGDQLLAPGWTEYRKRIQHQTYDVTAQVRSGANAFGAELGDGWWKGKIASFGFNHYGSSLGLIAKLRIDYTDGSSQVVGTDGTWRSHFGPFVQADNVEGESYDARAEQTGWDLPGFDASGWNPVTAAPDTTARLVPQPDEPVRVTEEVATKAHTTPAPGVEIYDLGQNLVGVARMRLQGQAGRTVTIRYGEELNPDGTLYVANLRSAKVTDTFTFATTGTRDYTPKFTQHGFRYVEITGTTTAPAAADVTGVVWGSDLADTGDLTTSDPMLNQLQSNISWGQRGNFLSVPTDTPARDERLGWTGDINVFAPTASYLTDTRGFLGKWMTDLRDAAYTDGNVPGIAPVVPNAGDFGSGLGWSDAAITVPYATWKSWDDGRIVRENYAAMEKFLAFVRASAGSDLIDSGRGHWEDWLNLDDPTSVGVLGTMYYAEDARMLSEMATAIGEDADAADYAQLSTAVRRAFTETFVTADGTVEGNSQAGYAMALGMGMVDDPALREKVATKFVAKLAANDYHLTTGFLGTPWLLPALSSIDRDDLAFTMLLHKDYPSWGYEIENGATTMWERWNSIMPDGSFGPVEMNSFNHYAYGAVGDWMYQNIGGITAVEAGYKKSRIAPVVGGGLTHGAGDFESVFGPITTDWTVTEGAAGSADKTMDLAVTVPVNTTAEVVLDADNAYAITESGALLPDADGVLDITDDGDAVTVTVGSGSYDFTTSAGNEQVGSVLVGLDALSTRIADLATAGDLTATDRTALDTRLGAVRDDVEAALAAAVAGDRAAASAALESALAGVRDLRAWLAASGVSAPVRGELDGSLAAVEATLARALSSAIGVSIALPPVSGPVLVASTATGTVEITNDGATPLTGLSGTVTVDGLGSVDVAAAGVAPGQTVQLPVSIDVPAEQAPGSYDAAWTLTYATGGETYTVSDTTPGWLTVTSGLEVGTPTTAVDGTDPSEHATVSVPVTNTGSADVRGHVRLTLPAGMRSVPSADTLLPAGATTTVTVPVVLPLDLVGGSVPLTVVVRRGADTLASEDATITVDLPRPPTAAVLDHVDFGEQASETAHAVQGAQGSGTSMEAGLTRRYAGKSVPGSNFAARVTVPAGQPFVLRNVETYDGPRTKKYDVFVDDVLVKTQLVPRAETGPGIKVYDALIDDPSLTANDGTVRIKFRYPVGADAFYDPSIADTWVLAVPADTQAPDVAAVVASGRPGNAGWYRSDVSVGVDAVDNRDAAPVVETGLSGTGSGWQAYAGPVPLTGDGRQTLSFRAGDAAGNTSGTRTLEVGIDATAPTTELAVTRNPGGESATVRLTATDATSGVAATRYRLDGGAWTPYTAPIAVQGFGDHVIEHASTDVAGNPEPVQVTTVSLTDVDVVTALLAPQLSGNAKIGATLRSTTGTWNTGGLTFVRQWLRNGAPIAGATGTSYLVRAADVGKRLSVRVTASKPTRPAGRSTSVATAPIAKATSRTATGLSATVVRAGGLVRVTSVVTGTGGTPSGKVSVLRDGRVVRTLWLARGRAVTTVAIPRGTHRIAVRYLGSRVTAPSMSATRTVKGR